MLLPPLPARLIHHILNVCPPPSHLPLGPRCGPATCVDALDINIMSGRWRFAEATAVRTLLAQLTQLLLLLCFDESSGCWVGGITVFFMWCFSTKASCTWLWLYWYRPSTAAFRKQCFHKGMRATPPRPKRQGCFTRMFWPMIICRYDWDIMPVHAG